MGANAQRVEDQAPSALLDLKSEDLLSHLSNESTARRHLLVDISAHGFGHVAQTAEVLNALGEQLPDLKMTIRTAHPRSYLATRIRVPFEFRERALDFGMVMQDALAVDRRASLDRYRDFHRNWGRRVDDEAEEMASLSPDLVLANIPYLSLAAAQRTQLPAVALCSLNWADIFDHYRDNTTEDRAILDIIYSAYASVDASLLPSPSMPMDRLPNRRKIGPIARPGTQVRAEIYQRAGLNGETKFLLAGLGGVPTDLGLARWPRLSGWRWIVPAAWAEGDSALIPWESLGLNFSDVLASVDAVLTKPGYGTFVECACTARPTLYLRRDDWPEAPYLETWLQRNGQALPLDRGALRDDALLAGTLTQVESLPRPAPPKPTGAVEAAMLIAQRLNSL